MKRSIKLNEHRFSNALFERKTKKIIYCLHYISTVERENLIYEKLVSLFINTASFIALSIDGIPLHCIRTGFVESGYDNVEI